MDRTRWAFGAKAHSKAASIPSTCDTSSGKSPVRFGPPRKTCGRSLRSIGVAAAPELLNDLRPPIVKHDELVMIEFKDAKSDEPVGLIVQWNCHPETLDSKNTKLSSDFVGPAVAALKSSRKCPVVYLSGAVGGLMTTIRLDVRDKDGNGLADGSLEKTNRYGELLAAKALASLSTPKHLSLSPFRDSDALARLAGG